MLGLKIIKRWILGTTQTLFLIRKTFKIYISLLKIMAKVHILSKLSAHEEF